MSRELAEQTHDIRTEIADVIKSEDRDGLLYLLKNLRRSLVEREIPPEEEEILKEDVDKFFADKQRGSMTLLLGPKGVPPFITIFRLGEEISLHLDNRYEDRLLDEKWKELQKAA